mmetsp:Transcript_143700/g.358210  ORF Transcript_143700/g.358210 Transcript_143700/m.358210 type:complete len:111 (+) Transcript_143700:237-569(+)
MVDLSSLSFLDPASPPPSWSCAHPHFELASCQDATPPFSRAKTPMMLTTTKAVKANHSMQGLAVASTAVAKGPRAAPQERMALRWPETSANEATRENVSEKVGVIAHRKP